METSVERLYDDAAYIRLTKENVALTWEVEGWKDADGLAYTKAELVKEPPILTVGIRSEDGTREDKTLDIPLTQTVASQLGLLLSRVEKSYYNLSDSSNDDSELVQFLKANWFTMLPWALLAIVALQRFF